MYRFQLEQKVIKEMKKKTTTTNSERYKRKTKGYLEQQMHIHTYIHMVMRVLETGKIWETLEAIITISGTHQNQQK